MRSFEEIKVRVKKDGILLAEGDDGCGGVLYRDGLRLQFIMSFGMGWEHVSVSKYNSCPIWDEMCFIKNFFWKLEECVIQYHPPQSAYVNNHPYCLHLWRPTVDALIVPPSFMV